ncbi:unnamed protein product [Closterium sp. NIES-54]
MPGPKERGGRGAGGSGEAQGQGQPQDEGEADLAATTSMEAAGVADTAATTRAMDAVADGSTESATIVTRTDICGGRGGGAASMKSAGNESESRDDRFSGQFFFVSTQAPAGPEKDEGFEEPAAVGKRAVVKGMGKAMLKGADGKMVGLKNITVVPMPRERQVAASISTKGEAVGSGDGANGRAKEIESKKCNLGGTSKLGEHEESGAAAQKQHKGEENPKAAAEEE